MAIDAIDHASMTSETPKKTPAQKSEKAPTSRKRTARRPRRGAAGTAKKQPPGGDSSNLPVTDQAQPADGSTSDAPKGLPTQVDVASIRSAPAREEPSTAEAQSAQDVPTATRGAAPRRRGRRGGRRRRAQTASPAQQETDQPPASATTSPPADPSTEDTSDKTAPRDEDAVKNPTASAKSVATKKEPAEAKPRRKATRSRRGKAASATATEDAPSPKARATPSRSEPTEFKDFEIDHPKLNVPGSRAMVINVSGDDECRIAILHEGRLEELFIERATTQSLVGNIYKGTVVNVESSIQAVFVDFGLPKQGFLHISDVQPQYFPNHAEVEEVGRKIPRHRRPPIQKCFRRGQEVIVQIIKQGFGTKGPTLTTYFSIPGQFLVMLPGMSRHGVSRKIEDDEARRRMRDLLNELDLPSGIGFIMRTAGLDQTKRELQRDLNYLLRLWKTVGDRIKRLASPIEVYQESDLITRTLRDIYTSDFTRLIVDDAEAAKRASDFMSIATPRAKPTIEIYSGREPLFHGLGIEQEIERISARQVPLPSGGSLVIDTTEAMVTIDVNSGRYRRPDDAEETAVVTNVEAAAEIARQLRLRDLGGLIVCDFIDMRLDRNKRAVERALRDALKIHKERARVLRMSAFGLIEITRQRQGPSIKQNSYLDCPHCRGSGLVKMPESQILDVMRTIQLAAHNDQVCRVIVTVASDVAFQVLNRKRAEIHRVELETGKVIVVRGDPHLIADQIECVGEDERGQTIKIRSSELDVFGAKRR